MKNLWQKVKNTVSAALVIEQNFRENEIIEFYKSSLCSSNRYLLVLDLQVVTIVRLMLSCISILL